MNITVKINLPDYIYRFYKNASTCVAGSSPEQLMADALSGYAGMLSKEVAKERENAEDREDA